MKQKEAFYKKVDEKIIKQTIHHEESIDENGVVIPAYDEVIDVVKPVYDYVYEEVEVKDEILSLENKVSDKAEPTIEERVAALEGAILDIVIGGM